MMMNKRRFLTLGMGSALVLAVAGGAVSLIQPGLVNRKLSDPAKLVLTCVARAMLAGTLPNDPAARQAALQSLMHRTDAFIGTLSDPMQAELSQLLSLLPTTAGRLGLVGLSTPWESATVAETTAALQSMRVSSISLKQQAYLGLHDIVCAPYFSGEESWAVLGYPGPVPI